MVRRDRLNVPRVLSAMLLVSTVAFVAGPLAVARPASAAVTAVKGEACGYKVNVGLFGGPQNLRGCGQTAGGEASSSPSVSLPPGGSATPITGSNPAGAKATYGPAAIFAGRWPADVSSAPPSGPISVSTEGTPSSGSVKASADIVLRTPQDPKSPGGFGPGPVEGDELHAKCEATERSVSGSVTFVNGLLSTSTDAEGSPKDQEAIPNSPPVNYTRSGVITNVGDVFTVVFNEQIVNPDGSLTVNAYHMYLFGPTAVGESIGGQVTCGTTPTTVSAADTVPPTCGKLVVAPVGPEDPTPKVPRTELIGVFDTGGLQSISNIESTNATVVLGNPESTENYLKFTAGQKGPLPIIATRTDESKTMTWSFDATDTAGNVTRSSQCPTDSAPAGPGITQSPSASPASGTGTGTGTGTGSGSGTGSGARSGSGSGSQSAANMAKTGLDVWPLVVAASALVAGGAMIVQAARRRRAAQSEHISSGWRF